ncbi:hypothetical protein [Desulfonatronum thiodismutans]|uniref:hypothetical protein n=1 Tax=Desulfonatronum thiodismutans TaxID=159290 RepID=UPI0012683594|nr:hypothetical protein [Desulfonatronum thiodismutans]
MAGGEVAECDIFRTRSSRTEINIGAAADLRTGRDKDRTFPTIIHMQGNFALEAPVLWIEIEIEIVIEIDF